MLADSAGTDGARPGTAREGKSPCISECWIQCRRFVGQRGVRPEVNGRYTRFHRRIRIDSSVNICMRSVPVDDMGTIILVINQAKFLVGISSSFHFPHAFHETVAQLIPVIEWSVGG